MRIALVSPYSWSYLGGVNRHASELSQAMRKRGHEVDVLAPWDPDDRLSRLLHGGRDCASQEAPEWLVPLGRTVGIPMNGAISNLSVWYPQVVHLRRALAGGEYDVVHVHEPVAPVVAWDATALGRIPTVGTFHTHSSNAAAHGFANAIGASRRLRKLRVRIAVSEAAKWTAERFFGGRYCIVPNGVDTAAALPGPKTESDRLRVLFVGRPEERKGLPVLIEAFDELSRRIPARLTVVGATREDARSMLQKAPSASGDRDIDFKGSVSGEDLWRHLHEADVLCAPSLGGESFGMVLVEAFAAGTPVVCSDIPGYRDVVADGVDSMVVPTGDSGALAHTLERLWQSPQTRVEMSLAGRAKAERFAWPHVADEILDAYEDALAMPNPAGAKGRLIVATETEPRDSVARDDSRELAGSEIEPRGAFAGAGKLRRRLRTAWSVSFARRVAMVASGLLGIGMAALAIDEIGPTKIADAMLRSSPTWVLVGLALMAVSPLFRALAWQAIIRASMPERAQSIRWVDVCRATLIGIVMSATLPARLGEPARAVAISRRIGSPQKTLPIVAGTIFSQLLLNLLALFILLGLGILASPVIFNGHWEAIAGFTAAPVLVTGLVIVGPRLIAWRSVPQDGAVGRIAGAVGACLYRVKAGLRVFSSPRLGARATVAQLVAWALQWLACYALLIALGLDATAGLGAAAAVLFAVNVSAAVPLTPSNLGVFQAAVVGVLVGAFGVPWAAALAYGIVLQAVELTTAVVMGVPAMLGEGVSWQTARQRAVDAAPGDLHPSTEPAELVARKLSGAKSRVKAGVGSLGRSRSERAG